MKKCSFCSICTKIEHFSRKMIIFANKNRLVMNKQPQLMDVTRMRDILTPHLSQMREHIFMNSELAMVRGDSTVRLKLPSTCKTATLRAAHSSISVLVPSSIPSVCRLTSASSEWDFFLTSPCPLHRDRCRRPSTGRCATSSYLSAKRISLLPDIFWTPFGKWFMPPTTIIVPPSQLS